MRNINRIILHCSATPEGRDFTVAQIDKCHRQRGFKMIGYHYVIYRDGSVHNGRPLSMIGAHTAGYNTGSIGICYIGGVATDGRTPKDTRTTAQKAAFVKLLTELHARFPKATLHGHREYANKACPSFDVAEYQYIFNK